METLGSKRKIRNFLINPRYQIKFALRFSAAGLFLAGINSAVFYVFIRENYKILVDLSPMEEEVKLQLYRELHQIVTLLAGFSVGFSILLFFMGILVSHRTAGPLYHFKRVFLAIPGGDLKARVHLRPQDEFRDVAEECNKMIDFLQK